MRDRAWPSLERLLPESTCRACASAVVAGLMFVAPGRSSADAKEGVSAGDQAFWVEQVADGLAFPSSMVWLPNDDLLVTERMGGLRVLRDGKLDQRPVSGAPQTYQTLYDGLKDIVLDPDYADNQALYLYVSEGTFDQHYAAVYRARYTASGLENVVRIFRSRDALGGYGILVTRMMFLADKTLLIAIAEDNKQLAQQLDSHKGKILRINRDGSVPLDNPFQSTAGALPEIWSYGHRAPLGLYQEAHGGAIWEIESGPQGGDELNVLRAGGNYGWPRASWDSSTAITVWRPALCSSLQASRILS